jgi:hypothetical protein
VTPPRLGNAVRVGGWAGFNPSAGSVSHDRGRVVKVGTGRDRTVLVDVAGTVLDFDYADVYPCRAP